LSIIEHLIVLIYCHLDYYLCCQLMLTYSYNLMLNYLKNMIKLFKLSNELKIKYDVCILFILGTAMC